MKKIFVLIAAAAIAMCSCKSHGPLCPAYSSVKKSNDAPVAATAELNKEKAS